MQDTVKINWKIVHIQQAKSPNSQKNSTSSNVQYYENSMENSVLQMYSKTRFVRKKKKKNIDFVECTKSQKVKGKLSALDEQNFRIHGECQIR